MAPLVEVGDLEAVDGKAKSRSPAGATCGKGCGTGVSKVPSPLLIDVQ